MSTKQIEIEKKGYLANWRKYPIEIKIMDLANLSWLVLTIFNLIFFLVKIEVNTRTFPIFIFPIFMFTASLALRLKLIEKPDSSMNVLLIWFSLFIFAIICTLLILIFYPALI